MSAVPPQDGMEHAWELSPMARALAARSAQKVNEMARRLTRASVRQETAHSGVLPSDVRNAEVAAAARHGMRSFVRRQHGLAHRPGHHAAFRERAAKHAEEGIPLQLLLRAHAMGAYMVWKTLRETARPGEEGALVELSGLLLLAQEDMAGAVAETYLDEQAALAAEQREERRAFVRRLLDGTAGADPAQYAAFGLERGALVLYLCNEPGAPRTPAGRTGAENRSVPVTAPALSPVMLRRRRRRVQTVLDRVFGTGVLTLLDDDGGHAVVPAGPGVTAPPVLPEGLVERLRRACGGDVRLTAVPAAVPSDIAEAAHTAREVVRVARASGRPPGLHRMADVLLEFHLSRRDESSDLIAALLDPIGGRPDLVETLRTHLEQQQDRRATARRLGLHPNTVDNRLARIAELTGLDLTSPRGTALALAALLLRDGERLPRR